MKSFPIYRVRAKRLVVITNGNNETMTIQSGQTGTFQEILSMGLATSNVRLAQASFGGNKINFNFVSSPNNPNGLRELILKNNEFTILSTGIVSAPRSTSVYSNADGFINDKNQIAMKNFSDEEFANFNFSDLGKLITNPPKTNPLINPMAPIAILQQKKKEEEAAKAAMAQAQAAQADAIAALAANQQQLAEMALNSANTNKTQPPSTTEPTTGMSTGLIVAKAAVVLLGIGAIGAIGVLIYKIAKK